LPAIPYWDPDYPLLAGKEELGLYIDEVKDYLEQVVKIRPPVMLFPDASCHKNEITDQDYDNTIRKTAIYPENDSQIKIQPPGKEAKDVTHQTLGFRSNKTKTWRDFIGILQNPPHLYHADADKKRKRIDEIGKKILKHLTQELQIQSPQGYKVYEKCREEGSGVYKLKFQIRQDEEAKTSLELTYEKLQDDELIDTVFALGKKIRTKKHEPVINEKEHARQMQQLETKFQTGSIVALKKGLMKDAEIIDALEKDKEEIVHDPYENRDGQKPDH